MSIKFDKIKDGMTLYDRHTYRMGNTTMKTIGEWKVQVISVDVQSRTATVSWNSNSPQTYQEHQLTRLSTWSMYDFDVERTTGTMGRIIKVRKLSKKELANPQ